MKKALLGLVTKIDGILGESQLWTRPDGHLVIRPRNRKPTPATSSEGWIYCQDCVSLLDTYARTMDYWHKQEWGICPPRPHGHRLSWLGHYYQVNIRRMLFGMPGLSYPPDKFRSHSYYWERDKAVPDLVGSGITLVVTYGYDKQGTPFDRDTGDIPPPPDPSPPPPPGPTGCPRGTIHECLDCPRGIYCTVPIDCCTGPPPPDEPQPEYLCPMWPGCPDHGQQNYALETMCMWEQSTAPCGYPPYDHNLQCSFWHATAAGPEGFYWGFELDRSCIEWPTPFPLYLSPAQEDSCPMGLYRLANPEMGPWPPAHVPPVLGVYAL